MQLVCCIPFLRLLPLISKKVKWHTKTDWLLPWRHAILSWRHFPLHCPYCGVAPSLRWQCHIAVWHRHFPLHCPYCSVAPSLPITLSVLQCGTITPLTVPHCSVAPSLPITLSVLQCGTITPPTVPPHNEHCVQSQHSGNFTFPYKTVPAITIMRHFLCIRQSHSLYKYEGWNSISGN